MQNYRIVVKGRLCGALAEVFDGFQVRCSASETELRGSVSDQAQLFGYLLRLRDLGIHLVSVNPVAS
jgi:hypothetical protein